MVNSLKIQMKKITVRLMSLVLLSIPVFVAAHDIEKDNKPEQERIASRAEIIKAALNETATTQKSIMINVTELRDNSGLVYLGGVVSKAELALYLSHLKEILGDDFDHYRGNQAARDHNLFHLTLINPNEYQFIDKNNLKIGQQLRVTLLGLGHVSKSNSEQEHQSYFIVAQSSDAQFFRQQYVLPTKDFHITLGFSPSDIYGVSKGMDTLIKDGAE